MPRKPRLFLEYRVEETKGRLSKSHKTMQNSQLTTVQTLLLVEETQRISQYVEVDQHMLMPTTPTMIPLTTACFTQQTIFAEEPLRK